MARPRNYLGIGCGEGVGRGHERGCLDDIGTLDGLKGPAPDLFPRSS